jgi:hypothetical protein
MKRISTLVLLNAFLLLPSFGSGQAQAPMVVVSAEPSAESAYRLRFSMRSNGARPVNAYVSDLPWGNVSSLTLIALVVGGSHISREGPLDDPDTATTQLAAGATLTGEVDLATALPGLERLAAKQEVVVFWSYRFSTVSGQRDVRTGGGCSFFAGFSRCWNEGPPK